MAFERKGIRHPFLVSLGETCRVRLAGLSNNWTRTRVAPVAVAGEAPILYKLSPFMNAEMARIAVDAHSQGKYPTFSRKFYEGVRERAKRELSLEPEDRIAYALSSNEDYDLTPEMDDTKFLLERETKEYFERFNHNSIRLYNLSDIPEDLAKDECIVNYLWFAWPEDGSGLDCGDMDLVSTGRAFGVLRKSAEGTSQNSDYSITSVRDAVKASIPRFCSQKSIDGLRGMFDPFEEVVLEELRKSKQ